MLQNKKIILAITGGIAAYKCAHLVRLLVKQGASVKVVLSASAAQFVTPQTLSVLSKNEVIQDFFDANFNWNNHVHLAEWADLMLVAPLTANSLAKMASGTCDNILLAVYFSMRGKVFVAPAMDLEMYRHATVKENLNKLEALGHYVIPAESGELASGLSGEGRMAEPENIVHFIENNLKQGMPFAGKKVLITAGPTHEAIDPVRFIGNRSSGKMGMALAETLAAQGAEVCVVLGPSVLQSANKNIQIVRVESADEMYAAVMQRYAGQHLVICSAAVADYKPAQVATSKMKKKAETFELALTKNPDILAKLGETKENQFLVGFALETENLLENAGQKLKNKNLDLIVANAANEPGVGFGHDTNAVSVIDQHNNVFKFELKSKADIALELVNLVALKMKVKG